MSHNLLGNLNLMVKQLLVAKNLTVGLDIINVGEWE